MSQLQPLSWNDAHFCGLRSQTNVYSLSKLSSSRDGRIKLLASSIDGQLASVQFEYQSSSGKFVPVTKYNDLFNSVMSANNLDSEGEVEVISIDMVCNWDDQEGGNILIVTYLKPGHYDEDKAPQAYMNIYQLSETESSNLYESSCLLQHMSLEFIPFKLTHHRIPLEDGNWETYLLLSGNDHKIHLYQPVVNYKGYYQEVDTGKHFPEFSTISDSVTQLEIKQLDDLYRLTSYGTQNGLICLFLVNVETKEILNTWTSEMDSPITSLHFFYQHTKIQCPDFLMTHDDNQSNTEEESDEEEALNLLVTSAVDPSAVYHDVITNGLGKYRALPVSNSQDVVLCSCVMDVDFDGENEVLIGTYGQVLLVYKLIYEKPPVYTSTPFDSPMPVPIHSDTPILNCEAEKAVKQEKTNNQDKDVRRRHKSVAAAYSDHETSLLLEKQDKHKSDECGQLDGNSQQALMSRLFRSQENLASPSTRSIHFETPDQLLTPDLTIPQFAMTPMTDFPCYKLIWTRRFCNPVMGLSCDDVMNDGMQDLVVLTLKGLHVLQPDLPEVATVVLNHLRLLCDGDTEADIKETSNDKKS